MNYRVMSRDPFGRMSYVRRIADAQYRACGWCGVPRKSPTGCSVVGPHEQEPRQLFQYGTLADDRSGPSWERGAFCSTSCARAHGRNG